MKKGATVSRTGAPYVLLVLTLSMCLVSSSAEARKWRWRHFYGAYDYGYVVPFGDDGWRDRVSEGVETARPRIGGSGFGAIIDRLIRGCVQQAADLQNLPFDEIARIVAPDDTQRVALEALRASARPQGRSGFPPSARRTSPCRHRHGLRPRSRQSTPQLQPLRRSTRRCARSTPRLTMSRRRGFSVI
jgi:hypothetical protein